MTGQAATLRHAVRPGPMTATKCWSCPKGFRPWLTVEATRSSSGSRPSCRVPCGANQGRPDRGCSASTAASRSSARYPSTVFDDALVTVYPTSDLHIGMLAWRRETGTPWDLAIARETVLGSMADLVGGAPTQQDRDPGGSRRLHPHQQPVQRDAERPPPARRGWPVPEGRARRQCGCASTSSNWRYKSTSRSSTAACRTATTTPDAAPDGLARDGAAV